MRGQIATNRHRREVRARWAGAPFVVACALVTVAALLPLVASAHGTPEAPAPHALSVALAFPDDGLRDGEELCVGLFAGGVDDPAAPDQRVCLGPGGTTVRFDGLDHGPYAVVLPAPGSTIADDRYQPTLAETEIPADLDQDAFVVDVALALAPEAAGTTGRVEINVFGCPPGTDGGDDAGEWSSECDTLIGDVPVSLSGIGSIDDTAPTGITALEGEAFGQAAFVDLPAGEYEIEEQLPVNVAEETAVFVSSSIDGGTTATPIEPDEETLALGPAEIKSVAYYVVLKPDEESALDDATSANPDVAAGSPEPAAEPVGQPHLEITGGLPPAATPTPAEPDPAG